MCQSQCFFVVFGLHRSLMNNEDTVVPAPCFHRQPPDQLSSTSSVPNSKDWLHDLFLGYGDPGAAQYWKLPTTLTEIDFRA